MVIVVNLLTDRFSEATINLVFVQVLKETRGSLAKKKDNVFA